MTLDSLARRASRDFRRAVEDLDRLEPERSSFARFDLARRRKQRNARVGAAVLASVVALAAILFATRAFPRAEQAAVPPINGRIAFVRIDPTYGDPVAFTMDPDGSDVTQLSVAGAWGHSEWPHWSPDGTSVTVFCCNDDPGAAYIVHADSGELRTLPLADARRLEEHCGWSWSPDGQLISCENYGNVNPRETGLWLLRSSDGSDLTQLTSNPGGSDIPGDFSPDGTRIVFLRSAGGATDTPTGLFVIGVNGTDLRRITPKGMEVDAFNGSWSPVGDQILFVARLGAEYRPAIWEVNADGTDLHQLPVDGCGGLVADQNAVGCTYPGWSPDGTKIVFTRTTEDGKRSDIAVVNADGSGLVQITHSGDADEADWGSHTAAP